MAAGQRSGALQSAAAVRRVAVELLLAADALPLVGVLFANDLNLVADAILLLQLFDDLQSR